MLHSHHRRYIVGFYRNEQKTIWGSVKTLFVLHNETGNVWTHLLGACTLQFTSCCSRLPAVCWWGEFKPQQQLASSLGETILSPCWVAT